MLVSDNLGYKRKDEAVATAILVSRLDDGTFALQFIGKGVAFPTPPTHTRASLPGYIRDCVDLLSAADVGVRIPGVGERPSDSEFIVYEEYVVGWTARNTPVEGSDIPSRSSDTDIW